MNLNNILFLLLHVHFEIPPNQQKSNNQHEYNSKNNDEIDRQYPQLFFPSLFIKDNCIMTYICQCLPISQKNLHFICNVEIKQMLLRLDL